MINKILKEKIITRNFYLHNIEQYFDTPIIKVLTWMRRVGKSFILKNIIQQIVKHRKVPAKNVFYINKEDLAFDSIQNYSDVHKQFEIFLKDVDKKYKIFVGIDEIQEIKLREKFINSILSTYGKNAEIFITWSNSNLLSSELSTLLTGRYIEFEIFPLSFDEYAVFKQEKKSKQLFLEHLKYGWLPGIFSMNTSDLVIFNYLKWIYSTILLKDIVRYFGLRNIDFFENLYKHVFANIGNIFSAKSISDYLKAQKIRISPETVLNYLWYGLKVYFIDIVKASDPDSKKYFEIYNKYYVWDMWVRNSIVWYDLKKDIGKLLENYVFLELKRHGYTIKLWRLKSWKEIDFIAEKQWKIKYLQVCYLLWSENTIEREYLPLQEIKDNRPKYVVSMDDIHFEVSDGIQHINIMKLSDIL